MELTDKAKQLGNEFVELNKYVSYTTNELPYITGLRKRELFAAMAMVGLLAQTRRKIDVSIIIDEAIICADALLTQLTKCNEI